jgi:hypothetical protein
LLVKRSDVYTDRKPISSVTQKPGWRSAQGV